MQQYRITIYREEKWKIVSGSSRTCFYSTRYPTPRIGRARARSQLPKRQDIGQAELSRDKIQFAAFLPAWLVNGTYSWSVGARVGRSLFSTILEPLHVPAGTKRFKLLSFIHSFHISASPPPQSKGRNLPITKYSHPYETKGKHMKRTRRKKIKRTK